MSVSASVYAREEGEALDTTPAAPASREPAGGGAPGRAGAAGEPSPRGGAARGPPPCGAASRRPLHPRRSRRGPGKMEPLPPNYSSGSDRKQDLLIPSRLSPPSPPALSLPVIF